MRLQNLRTFGALALILVGAGRLAAAEPGPATPAALSPCALGQAELESTFGLTVDQIQASDMALPGGRDVGCLYTFKNSSFEVTVRQTWEGSRAASAAKSDGKPIAGDPDGAAWKTESADRPGAGGDLTYLRGKVRTRVHVRGGRLTGTEVLKKLLLLRRVP